MAKTTFSQKLSLVIFGVAFTFLILEVVLRLGGFLFLSVQEQANRRSADAKGEYNILCLGESTTALGGEDAYPRQLERILNSRQSKIKFKVINKGVPATTTDQILARSEIYLREYHPNLVVAMIGINDPPLDQLQSLVASLSEKSRVIRLLHLIFQHLKVKHEEQKGDALAKSLQSMEAKIDQHPSVNDYNKIAEIYRGMNHPQQEYAVLLKSLALDPEHQQTNFLLGVYYERQAEYAKALAVYKKSYAAIRNSESSEKDTILSKMAECYKFLGDYPHAEKSYLEIVEQSSVDSEAHEALADIYLEQKDYASAQKHYTEQIKIHPDSAGAYNKLAYLYRMAGKEQVANALLKQGEPYDSAQGGNQKKAPNARTKKNYARLYQILRQQSIPLVAVQYPARPVQPLKQMLTGLNGVIVVDNERNFRDALAQATYDDYFFDRFAGDFGHATPKGNALLAGHIAEVILKEIVK